MNPLQERGLELAATRTIRRKGKIWLVPSASGTNIYEVDLENETPSCTCAYFKSGEPKCKHIFAAGYAVLRKQNAGQDAVITKALKVTEGGKQRTYPQVWSAYNKAQTNEKDYFLVFLAQLCGEVSDQAAPREPRRGRPSLPLADAIFAIVFKVYSTYCARRFMSDLRAAARSGFISGLPHYNSISNYLEKPEMTPILKGLVERSAVPLSAVEVDFAADSSGFTTSRFHRWFDCKYGKIREQHHWVKCHIVTGVKTNIVTAIEIGDRDAHDAPFLLPMLATTARNFKVSEFLADKAYGSRKNVEGIEAVGGIPFIALKSNATGGRGGGWEKMVNYFKFRQDDFLAHYHKRSNAEATFSMVKSKFRDSLRSKTDIAMVNEVLCKFVCHNIVVFIHEMMELKIDPSVFKVCTNNQEPAQKFAALHKNSGS